MEALIVMELMKRLDTETLENTDAEEIGWAAEKIFEDEETVRCFLKKAD
jgi:hypothetical protein